MSLISSHKRTGDITFLIKAVHFVVWSLRVSELDVEGISFFKRSHQWSMVLTVE